MGIVECCNRQITRENIVSKITVEHISHNIPLQKALSLSHYFPCKYLGQGIYGCTIEVFSKQNKQQKYAQKIIHTKNLQQNYAFLNLSKMKEFRFDDFIECRMWKAQKKKFYVFMEEMRMGDLYSYLKKNKRPFDNKNLRQIGVRVVKMLEKLHKNQLIYRSLRPENILFANKQCLLLFSESLFCIEGPTSYSYFGSAEYCPPQVWKDLHKEGYTYSLDIWMFGVLLCELILKSTPFQGQSIAEIRQMIINFSPQNLEFPEEMQITEDLQTLIERMLDPNPKTRITLNQIKKSEFFSQIDWQQVKSEITNIWLKYCDKDEKQTPKRTVYYNLQRSRPLTQDFYEVFLDEV